MTNAMDETYELVTILGKPAAYVSGRIASESVPECLHRYEVRHADNDILAAAQIAPVIVVNQMGTLLMRDELQMDERGYLDIKDSDLVFSDSGRCELDEYIRNTEPKEKAGKDGREKNRQDDAAR